MAGLTDEAGVWSTQRELANLGLAVTPENVLQLRNALAAEVDRLREEFPRHRRDMYVGECGGDPLSRPVAEAFNRKIKTLTEQNDAYLAELADARDRLHQAARDYGHTEDDISRSFEAFQSTLPGIYAEVRADLAQRAGGGARPAPAPGPPA